jgi:EmrB/QacA subfamily drug resistance transporter
MVDSSIVTVSLPAIATSLHSSLGAVQWVASAYLLSLGLTLALVADGAKRWGSLRLYTVGLMGFTLFSGLSALAPSLPWLIATRVAQGLFGGPLVPLAMNMMFGGNGHAQKQMPAVAGMVLFLAPAIAPALGGVLIHWGGWPFIFLVNVPVGVLALVGVRHVPSALGGRPHAPAPPFDSVGFVGLALALTAVTYGAVEGPQRGWWAASVWPIWAGGLLLLIAYGGWARYRRHPIVDVSVVANGQAVLALIVSALVSVVTFGVIFLVPVFMQTIQGRTPLVAGLTLLPQGLVTGVGAVIGNQLPGRWGTRPTVLLGMALLTASTVDLYVVTVMSPAWLTGLLIIGRGFAIGLVIQPLLNGLMGVLPDDRIPDGTTLFNIVERVGGTVGIGLLVALFTARETAHLKAVALRHHLSSIQVRTDLNHPRHTSAAAVHFVQNAETFGFHDVIGVIAGISMVGCLLAVAIREPQKERDHRA